MRVDITESRSEISKKYNNNVIPLILAVELRTIHRHELSLEKLPVFNLPATSEHLTHARYVTVNLSPRLTVSSAPLPPTKFSISNCTSPSPAAPKRNTNYVTDVSECLKRVVERPWLMTTYPVRLGENNSVQFN
jgi:hypothetical protein